MKKIILITGGQRSGKSTKAEELQEYNWDGNNSEDYRNIIARMQLSEASNATFGYGRGKHYH